MIANGRFRCARPPRRPERRQSGARHHRVDNDALRFDGEAPRPRGFSQILVAGAQTIKPEADLTIRPARLPEDPVLHALSLRSKANWGYDTAFMAKAAPLLALQPEWYAAGRILVADFHGRPAGVGAILAPDHHGVSELAHLFVDPPCMGRGIGGTLLAHLLARARSDGARRATVLSDPFARHFYERLGARFVRDDPSEGVDGRALPVLAWEFPG